MENSSCVILVPVYEHIELACEESLQLLEAQGYEVRRVRGAAAIDVARSRMATRALADGFQEIMWIDSDIAFEQDAVDRIRAHGLPIVGGIYPKKAEAAVACHLREETEVIELGDRGGLLDLHYTTTGFLYTKRCVYDDIRARFALPVCNARFDDPIVPYFLPMVIPDGAGHWYLAEDFAFAERARQVGYRMLADTTIRLFHVGRYAYSWEDFGGDRPRHFGMRVNVDRPTPKSP